MTDVDRAEMVQEQARELAARDNCDEILKTTRHYRIIREPIHAAIPYAVYSLTHPHQYATLVARFVSRGGAFVFVTFAEAQMDLADMQVVALRALGALTGDERWKDR